MSLVRFRPGPPFGNEALSLIGLALFFYLINVNHIDKMFGKLLKEMVSLIRRECYDSN